MKESFFVLLVHQWQPTVEVSKPTMENINEIKREVWKKWATDKSFKAKCIQASNISLDASDDDPGTG